MPGFSAIEEEFLERRQVGRLATATRDGVPHVVALCYANDAELIYMNTGDETRKGRNIRSNSKVAFIVDEYVGWDEFRGVLIWGEAEFKTAGSLFEKGRDLIYAKYPRWEEAWPITENESHVLVVNPTRVVDWGLS